MLPEEEAPGGDEDREKEILIERIQSIKEEKQVSLSPSRPHPQAPLSPRTWPLGARCIPIIQLPTSWGAAALTRTPGLCLNPTCGRQEPQGAHRERRGSRGVMPKLRLEVGLSSSDPLICRPVTTCE